jgi:hypothetical protein
VAKIKQGVGRLKATELPLRGLDFEVDPNIEVTMKTFEGFKNEGEPESTTISENPNNGTSEIIVKIKNSRYRFCIVFPYGVVAIYEERQV